MPRRADAAVIVSRIFFSLTRSISVNPPYKSAPTSAVALELIAVMSFVVVSTSEGHPRNASEIARHVGIPRETVSRRLRTLIESGRIKLVDRRYVADLDFYDRLVNLPQVEEWFRLLDACAKQLADIRAALRGRDAV
ncbi:helix-turn-helix domain-containing protein [Bradyrhizobium sp. 150]|uniref:helix-turn-helix domain-containing protein n=1 Tax=Bradyrhizobium sp. 150 TaxID=2782625 RepID=UPI001FF75972|nr:helix-turn-helix domain-containing protein [Bradyrhizobium sp. 150]MCK1670374.1 helix-turn-helix transcriptional regulator [Bradyrhizobium sp. 150]